MPPIVAELTHHVALLPMLAVLVLSLRGKVDAGWWWLAGAFLVSWVTDGLAHVVDPVVLSVAYPMMQALLVVGVVLSWEDALAFLWPLAILGILLVFFEWPLFLLRAASFVLVSVLVWQLPASKLRSSLLLYFLGGLLCWGVYLLDPGWVSWGFYQGVRLAAILLFCWAVFRPVPSLKVA